MNTNKFNVLKVFVLVLVLLSSTVFFHEDTVAATTFQFTKNLSRNKSGQTSDIKNDVKILQQFLTDQGLYSGPITGNYLSLTYRAVQAFQIRESITPTNGNFGPITRARANQILSQSGGVIGQVTPTGMSTTAITDLSTPTNDTTVLQARVNYLYERVWSLQIELNKRKKKPTPTPTPISVPTTTPISTPTPYPTPMPTPTPYPTPTPTPTPIPPTQPSTPSSNEIKITAYLTGYTYWDNTPPGSADISNPIIHSKAGGTGTFVDPITLAVGHSLATGKDVLDYPAGTKFYIPNLRRYFIVEDTCGDGNTPQNIPCHNLKTADAGAQAWLDLWIDGSKASNSTANSCAEALTANFLVIQNPSSNYLVVPGSVISGTSCPSQYGNTLSIL